MTAPRVVGLDLSLVSTGIATDGGKTLTVKTSPKEPIGLRLSRIVHDTAFEWTDGITDLVVIEDLPTHAKSAGITGKVHGAVLYALWVAQITVVTVPPASLKKYATGVGNCDKAAMILAAYKRGLGEFTDDNQADAAWLRAMGMDALGCPVVAVPEAHRAALAKVAWPQVAT